MNAGEYFRDLSLQFRAVQNRIRQLIGHGHWPSDGAWKESVVRAVLRGYLPPAMFVGGGFIVTPDGVSTEIDLLILDDSAPVLFRDGDFVVSTPEAVRAIVEVKTSLPKAKLRSALRKLNDVSSLMRKRPMAKPPFIGLFCFEPTDATPDEVLNALKAENGGNSNYEISALSFGDTQFFRFWELDPSGVSRRQYDAWHAYILDDIAQGYFVHNIVERIYPHAIQGAEKIWYPIGGKEGRLIAQRKRKVP